MAGQIRVQQQGLAAQRDAAGFHGATAHVRAQQQQAVAEQQVALRLSSRIGAQALDGRQVVIGGPQAVRLRAGQGTLRGGGAPAVHSGW